jgi:hypothetical protein
MSQVATTAAAGTEAQLEQLSASHLHQNGCEHQSEVRIAIIDHCGEEPHRSINLTRDVPRRALPQHELAPVGVEGYVAPKRR